MEQFEQQTLPVITIERLLEARQLADFIGARVDNMREQLRRQPPDIQLEELFDTVAGDIEAALPQGQALSSEELRRVIEACQSILISVSDLLR